MVQFQKPRKNSKAHTHPISNKYVPVKKSSSGEVDIELLIPRRPTITPVDVESHFKETDSLNEEKKERKHSISPFWEETISSDYIEAKRNSSVHESFRLVPKGSIQFLTNSRYFGGTNSIGLSGFGQYVLPNDVIYTGKLEDSMFHGHGSLHYPIGQKVKGVWCHDELLNFEHKFPEGLPFEKDWWYCRIPDRRYWLDLKEGLQPVCTERLTNDIAPRKIPEGCYDVGEGFYNPKNKCIVHAGDLSRVIRIPSVAEERWIMKYCRKAWDEPTGYRPDLYECWVTGRRREEDCFHAKEPYLEDFLDEEETFFNEEEFDNEAETIFTEEQELTVGNSKEIIQLMSSLIT